MSNNSNNDNNCDNRLERIKQTVKSYPDFPKKGVLFRDLFPVLTKPDVFKDLLDILTEEIQSIEPKAEAIIGLESRGFLLGPTLALNLKLPFIPVRKPGKLPGSVQKVEYSLEYGKDSLEIQSESIAKNLKCVLIDDLIATGGSLKATIDLINSCGGQVIKSLVVMELVELKGRSNIGSPLYSMIQY